MTTWWLRLFDYFKDHKGLLIGIFGVLIIGCGTVVATSLRLQENIGAMLPDDDSRLARDFQLLQEAPFARKIMMSVQSTTPLEPRELIAVTRNLETELKKSPLFTSVSGGFDAEAGMAIMEEFNTIHPALYTKADMAAIGGTIAKDAIESRVQSNLRALMSPDGMMNKQQIINDPLNLSQFSLEKLDYVQLVQSIDLVDGRFIGKDGRHALLIGETNVEMTDSRGGRQLIDTFEEACRTVLPAGTTGTLLSSHCYTVANAEMIQQDLSVILTVTTIGILLIFGVYMRCWGAVAVFLFPLAVIVVALAVTSLVFSTVSGITLGFGAVLMGITVDFALHIYFAIREKGERKKGLQEVVKPGLVCALTTIAAFAVLQLSNLPGQRQLSVFSVSGVVAAVMIAFILLPHVLPDEISTFSGKGLRVLDAGCRVNRAKSLGIWGILVLIALPGVFKLTFDGDLRQLNAVPDDLRATEMHMSETWGDFRSRAMIFAEGKSLQEALIVNDQAFEYLTKQLSDNELLSVSAVLPADITQQKRLDRWQNFLAKERGTIESRLAAGGWPSKATATAIAALDRANRKLLIDELRQTGLKGLLDSMIVEANQRYYVISLVPDEKELADNFENHGPASAHFVSQRSTGDAIGEAVSRDFRRFISYALAAVCLLVIIRYRRLSLVAAALSPVFTGALGLFAFMGYAGISMNIFNVVASILIVGLGVDYGVFMVHKTCYGSGKATVMAVWVSALTTMAGFGALILGRHPALFSIGITVSVGIVCSILTALFVVPALVPMSLKENGQE